MKLLTTFFILAALVSAAPITQVKLVNAGNPVVVASSVTIDGDTKHNVDIGPYTLLINGQDYAALCVAFFDESHLNDTWNAYVTQIGSGNFSNTYNLSEGQEYEEDAYIMSQILKPGSDRSGLQEAACFGGDAAISIGAKAPLRARRDPGSEWRNQICRPHRTRDASRGRS
jgi:hypothetical protein